MRDPLGDQGLALARAPTAIFLFRRRDPQHRADLRFAALCAIRARMLRRQYRRSWPAGGGAAS
jgi:hypothetical protein